MTARFETSTSPNIKFAPPPVQPNAVVDPNSIAMREALARELQQQSSGIQQIESPWQGLAQLAGAAFGGYTEKKAADDRAQNNKFLAEALGGAMQGDVSPDKLNQIMVLNPALGMQIAEEQRQRREEANAKAEEQAQRQQVSAALRAAGKEQAADMFDAGALDPAKAAELLINSQVPEAPKTELRYNEETGREEKVQWDATVGDWVPMGGQKAPSNGTSLSVDADGNVTFSQGGPQQQGMPYDPTRNPGQLGKKLSEADARALEGYREAAVVADDLSATVDGLEMTIGNVGYTGPGGELYGTIDDVIGVLPGDTGARGAAKSLAMEAQLAMTAKTKGAITDREMGMFKQAVPGLGQTGPGNAQIIAAMRAMTNRVKTRAAFMEEFVNAKGSMNGAQAAWRTYIEDNPVLAQGPNGELVVQEEADFSPYQPGGAGGGGDYQEGTIAENPQTGEQLIYQGGEWVPFR